ncbi:MAG: hypothetical protein ACLQT5_14485 [Steroidobacteraceae bacterium]|jgi:hypothetical protein
MRSPERRAWPGGAAVLWTALGGLALGAAAGAAEAACPTGRAALQAMLASEYAFAEQAQTSVSGAFLAFLADDSLVLNPAPQPGRAVYQAAKNSADRLEWYPSIGDISSSADLGFTSGPWVYTAVPSGKQYYGHFLTVWKRSAECRWRVEFDGGTSHAAPSSVESKLLPEHAPFRTIAGPPPVLVARDGLGQALSDFQSAVQRDGLASALSTYGHRADFRFYTDGQTPIDGVAAARSYLNAHAVAGAWKEAAHGRSADSTLMYSVGEFTDSSDQSTHAYVQIWQYDPKATNWGLRVLLLNPLPRTHQ